MIFCWHKIKHKQTYQKYIQPRKIDTNFLYHGGLVLRTAIFNSLFHWNKTKSDIQILINLFERWRYQKLSWGNISITSTQHLVFISCQIMPLSICLMGGLSNCNQKQTKSKSCWNNFLGYSNNMKHDFIIDFTPVEPKQ